MKIKRINFLTSKGKVLPSLVFSTHRGLLSKKRGELIKV